jgi:hypothetical protein
MKQMGMKWVDSKYWKTATMLSNHVNDADMDQISKLNQAVCAAIVLIGITGTPFKAVDQIRPQLVQVRKVWAQQRVIRHRAPHKRVCSIPCKSDSFIIFECGAPRTKGV